MMRGAKTAAAAAARVVAAGHPVRSSAGRLMRVLALGLGALALSACVEGAGSGGGAAGSGTGSGPATRKAIANSRALSVAGGEISIQPLRGYCIDPEASRQTEQGAVVLSGRCSGNASHDPALITTVVGKEGSSSVLRSGAEALSNYFVSPAGRAALARNGDPRSVQIRRSSVIEGALVLLVEDAGLAKGAERSSRSYWRAILGLRGRLITLSVSGTPESPLGEEAGRDLLLRSLTALRKANPGQVDPGTASKGSASDSTASKGTASADAPPTANRPVAGAPRVAGKPAAAPPDAVPPAAQAAPAKAASASSRPAMSASTAQVTRASAGNPAPVAATKAQPGAPRVIPADAKILTAEEAVAAEAAGRKVIRVIRRPVPAAP